MTMAGKRYPIVVALIALSIGIACLVWGRYAWPGAWFVRGYVGDVVVIVFIVAVLRATMSRWLDAATCVAATVALALSLEILQTVLHAKGAVGTALGTTFDWYDLVAYAAGAALSWLMFRPFAACQIE
jgi:hypothetical protein